MKRRAGILARSMILTLLLTLLLGSLVVHAEEEVKINYTSYTVNLGDEDNVLQLKMENLGDKKPRWVSYNVNVARVDQEGVVTPLRKGTAIISSGIGFPRKTCVVTVVDPSVVLNKSTATLYRSNSGNALGNTITLTAKVSGAKKATDVEWSSSDETIAKVVKDIRGRGVVTSADQDGEVVITAKVNGRTASCKVTVLTTALELNTYSMQLSTRGAGSSIRLVPTVVGPKRAVTWTSSDRKIATVSGGKVTGKKEGTVIVTAMANGEEAACTVTVKPGQISINRESEILYVTKNGSEVTAETKELKTNATNGEAITWSSSNEAVVQVEGKNRGKAKITAVGRGNAVIIAECNGRTDTCKIEVVETKTYIDEDDVHLKTRGTARTYTLNYHVEGRNKAIWTSSDTKVVSVSRGKLVGKKAGSAIVTVKANGMEDKVRVTVTDTPTISLDQKEYTLYTTGKGNTVTLKAIIEGANKKVTWASNASKIAEVNAKGKVTAKGEGSALITATANGVTAKCWVNVKTPKIFLEKNALVIKAGEKVNLCDHTSMEITGANQSVTYKSGNAKVAAVDKNGLVTGKKAGNTKITIKANGVEVECFVTVSACESHKFGDAETLRAATCEESGLVCKTCSDCGGKEQTVTPPLGHDFGAWTVVSKPTETEVGLEKQVCTRDNCNEENTRTIPAKNKGELAYGYNLMWEDDFDGETLDRSAWNVETHDPGWVNAEWQEYVDDEKNIYVKDGNLVIQAIKDGDKYTSGRINTQNKHDYTYGKFEVRAKVPSGKGFLPAFWMMPTDENYYGQWPKCGEIDVMEVLGDQTKKVHSTLHFGEPHTQQQGTYTLSKGDFSKEFHVYACEWDPGEMRFYVDGILFYTVNDWFTQKPGFGKAAYPAPYDQPFYMILNLAVGGSWVGYPDANTKFGDNAQLVVDYVRVYQKDNYDDNVEKPDKEVQLRDPDASGNYIINGDFAKAERLPNGANWKLLLAGKGKATAAIKNKELQITTTNAGELNYSVQIVQADLPLEKDCKYKLSYDAYADEARTMITDISAPDRGYIRYLEDKTDELTTEKKHFEHTFDMKSDSDANGRVEFNLGNQGSTAKVYITNVRLEKDGDADEDVKGMLPDGNFVYNGFFNEGDEEGRLRLAYWDWDTDKCKDASVSVTRDADRELKVVVPDTVSALDDVVVYQKPIAITGGKKYVLSFDAHADQEKTIETTIAGETYRSELTKAKTEYRYEFETAADLNGSELRFLLGAPGTTYIDNVRIREDKMIVNGDFSSGDLSGFEVYVNDAAKVPGYTVDSLNEQNAFSIDIADTGAQDWYIQLKQNNIKLEKDQWYEIAFDAKSTLDRKIMYALQRDGSKHNDDWTPYSGSQIIDLTGEWKNFSHKFKMTEGTDPETILSISMGAVGGTQIDTKHTVRIDNITLDVTDPVEIPPVDEGEEMIKNGDFSEGDAHWENAVTEPGAAEVSFADGKAVYNITNVGTLDWHIQLKHKEKLTLERGAEYAVKFNIKSTEARTVKYAFLNPNYKWYGGEDLKLEAGVEKAVNYKWKVDGQDDEGNDLETSDQITFVISMGLVGTTTPTSTIEIDNISVKKIGGSGEEKPIVPVAPGTELIKNGDFSKGKEDWTESGIYADGQGTESFEDGKAVYKITNVGTDDWHVQLKQTGLTLEKDAKYKLRFKIKSTAARNVMYKLQDPDHDYADYGSETIGLEADTERTVEKEITVDKVSSKSIIFVIAMGKIGGDESLPEHTIEIDDVSLVKLSGTGGEEPDEPVDPSLNLIKNGDFAAGEANWVNSIWGTGAAEASFADGKATYEITNVGTEDSQVQLRQEGLTLEKGATYKVRFKIKSSVARTVKSAVMNYIKGGNKDGSDKYDWYNGDEVALTAGTEKTVTYDVEVGEKETSSTIQFVISMGKVGSEAISDAHTIEIDDVSLVKVGGSGDEGDTGDEEPILGNLIKNGDFEAGKGTWESYIDTENAEADVSFEGGKATYVISNVGTEDHHIQLKQGGLTLEKGATYNVKFTIKSTVARTVKSVLQDTKYVWYGGKDDVVLNADEETKVAYRFTVGEDRDSCKTIDFVISMGKLGDSTPTSTIEIDNVSVEKELITNGDFAGENAENGWSKHFATADAGTATFTAGKVRYEIANTGENDWDVQLKQTGLKMEKGATYKVNFKIASTIDRDVKLAFMGANNVWYGGDDNIALVANKLKSFSRIVTVDKDINGDGTLAFQLSMGQIGNETLAAHAIEISDISIVQVAAGTTAIPDVTEDAEIDPPAANEADDASAPKTLSSDDTDDDSDAVVEEEEDDQDPEDQEEQDPEDQDDKSDDPSDDEDADSADQETSDDQDDSGDAETSDGRSGGGSGDASEASDDSANAQTTEN